MAIWIQSLSWTLIYALGQGFVVYAALWLVLKLMPTLSASVKYHLSLSSLTVLLTWFGITWWQQYHSLALVNQQLLVLRAQYPASYQQQIQAITAMESYGSYRMMLSAISPWLSAFYIIGLLLMLVRLSGGMLQLFSLRKSGISRAGTTLDEMLRSLKSKLHIDGPVQLFISARAQVPMVIGFIKPVILMPAAAMAQLSMQQLETILLHELAHIKRYDYFVNILQTVAETILFFNPFVWMISSITRREREHCCDDLVLAHTSEPLHYATALAALATDTSTVSDLAIAASGQSNHLFNRIKRIMEMKKNPFSYSRTAAAILIIAAITCSIVWLTPSIAGPKKDKTTVTKTRPATITPVATTTAKPAIESTRRTSPKPATVPTGDMAMNPPVIEENVLIQHLMTDRMVDEVKGFLVERKQDKLFIDGKEQPDEVATKYLSRLEKKEMRVKVYPFNERVKQHPGATLMQLIQPVSFSSECVDNRPKNKKDGC